MYLKFAVFILGLIFLANNAMAEQPQERILTMEDSGKEIDLAIGETITLQLEQLAATASVWYSDELDESHLKLTNQDQVAIRLPKKGGVGQAGGSLIKFWTFKAVATGDTVLRMLDYRPWIGKEHPVHKFEIKIHITGTDQNNILNEPPDLIKKETASAKAVRRLDFYDDRREFTAGTNDIIIVELKVSDKSGSQWFIDGIDQSLMTYIGKKEMVVSPKTLAEGPIFEHWFFKTIAPGDATLTLVNYRFSDGVKQIINKFEVKLHIADKK